MQIILWDVLEVQLWANKNDYLWFPSTLVLPNLSSSRVVVAWLGWIAHQITEWKGLLMGFIWLQKYQLPWLQNSFPSNLELINLHLFPDRSSCDVGSRLHESAYPSIQDRKPNRNSMLVSNEQDYYYQLQSRRQTNSKMSLNPTTNGQALRPQVTKL